MSDTLEFPEVEDIFASIGTDPMKAREAAREVLIQVGNDPEKMRDGKYAGRAKKAKATRTLGHTLSNKAVDYYKGLGYMAFRVDYTGYGANGSTRANDLLGIADVLAFKHGDAVLIQSTVETKRNEHERKLCDNEKVIPRVQKTPYQCAIEWMEKGGRIVMFAFEKNDRGHWAPNIFEVTREWLDERKAKLDARRQK